MEDIRRLILGVNEYGYIGGRRAFKLCAAGEEWIRHLSFVAIAADEATCIVLLSVTKTGSGYSIKYRIIGDQVGNIKIFQDGDSFYLYNNANVGTAYMLYLARECKDKDFVFDVVGKTAILPTA